MNLKQMKWAESHNWFVRSRRNHLGTFTVVVRGWNGVQQFYDFAELRAWAGY